MFTKAFLQGLAERAIKTFAQSLSGAMVVGVGIFALDWKQALSVALAATLASLLTSVASPDFVAGRPDVVIIEDDHA